MKISVFGIRHHGCGSARSVRRALGELAPDIVLIEGAPEANEIIPLAAHPEIKPPVAILIYAPDNPQTAVYYPFAEFSPEWQAIQFALETQTPVRFIDLPQSWQLSEMTDAAADEEQNANNDANPKSEIRNPKSQIRRDPLQFAAEAAGFADGEIWWENLVETRGGEQTHLFAGISELMTALREQIGGDEIVADEQARDERREAFMRQEIRRAAREGFRNAAVVCGAWHAPALAAPLPPAREDQEKLKNPSKIKLAATWIPYTSSRLSFASGYGAGVQSPEFYYQIWRQPANIAAAWLARAAALLREQDLDASPASVIEAVRLAETLAALRGLAAVGLSELTDAARSVLCFGDNAPLGLIGEKLIIGERLGEVPAATPAVPLQQDLKGMQKRLRLAPAAAATALELDLRKPFDLERSRLLHRLGLLDVGWGSEQKASGKGTFKENWRLQWQPELEIAVIEANVWGNTIAVAAAAKVRDAAAKTDRLAELTVLVGKALLSDLPAAIDFLMTRLETAAAVSSDVPAMMDAAAPLADVLRYGNARKTDTAAVRRVVDGLTTRVCLNLPNACAALDDQAAAEMFERIVRFDNVVGLLQNDEYSAAWRAAARRLADADKLHGLVGGRAARLLFDAGELSAADAARRINLTLSTANEPARGAAWIEGFLRGSGLILLHNENLLKILDDWVKTLSEPVFVEILPLLRRTFATFHQPERRQIGERIKNGVAAKDSTTGTAGEDEIDVERANRVLPLVARLLGLSPS